MINVLKPDLIWIEGRCYRVTNPLSEETILQEHDMYETEVTFNDSIINEGDDDDEFEIVTIDDNRYSTSFHVSKHYIGSIIGKKGAVKQRIERDTRTEIKIPKQGQTGDIVVFGSNPSSVKAARRRINIIVISSRMKQRCTHFLSIPMNSPDVMKRFEEFRDRVCSECPSRGLDQSIFIQPTKLHITLGVMCLMDSEERLLASKLLNEAKENIIKPMLQGNMPLRLKIKGLSYMNDDPREIDVLYGLVQEDNAPPGLLQNLADTLVDHFYKAGFMDKEHGRENVKIHVTLINSKYRSPSSSYTHTEDGSGGRHLRKPRESFDGTEIIQKFADFEFGVVEVTDIHLSQRNSLGPDGYYQATCIIPFKNIS